MATYTVTFITPEGNYRIRCKDSVYILDQAEEEGVDLPYSCRAGCCTACVGRLRSGSVDQGDQSFLDDCDIESGYVCLCTAYPASDCVIETHCETELGDYCRQSREWHKEREKSRYSPKPYPIQEGSDSGEEIAELGEVVVFAEPTQALPQHNVKPIFSNVLPIGIPINPLPSEVVAAFNANELAFKQLKKHFQRMAIQAEKAFNPKDKRAYEKAQKLYREMLKKPHKKYTQKQLNAMKKAVTVDEFKRLQIQANNISKNFAKLNTINDLWNVGYAIVESFNRKDWRPIFDTVTAIGASVFIGRALLLLIPGGIPTIMISSAVSAVASYYLSEQQIAQWRLLLETRFKTK